MMTTLPLSGLGLAAGGGPLGQDTENVPDIVTTMYIVGRWRCRRLWQCITVYCVQLWRVCTLRRLEERAAGQDQIGILMRGDTYTVTRPHSINITRYTRYDHMTDSGWSEENSYAGHLSCWCETCTCDLPTMSVSTLLDLLELNNFHVYKTQPVCCLMQS